MPANQLLLDMLIEVVRVEDVVVELYRRAAGVASICLKSSGALQLNRVEMRRYGGMETACKRADVVT